MPLWVPSLFHPTKASHRAELMKPSLGLFAFSPQLFDCFQLEKRIPKYPKPTSLAGHFCPSGLLGAAHLQKGGEDFRAGAVTELSQPRGCPRAVPRVCPSTSSYGWNLATLWRNTGKNHNLNVQLFINSWEVPLKLLKSYKTPSFFI